MGKAQDSPVTGMCVCEHVSRYKCELSHASEALGLGLQSLRAPPLRLPHSSPFVCD